MKLFKLSLMLIALLTFAVSCNDGGTQTYDENVTVTPANPIGSIGGVVFDGATDSGLENVQVTAIVGSSVFTTTTDGTGVFSIDNVPATGKVILIYESTGYYGARQIVNFSESESNQTYESPTATANPVYLISSGKSIQIRLVDPEGKPVPQVPLTLSVTPSYFILNDDSTLQGSGEIHKSAGTNNLGLASFEGLPNIAQLGDGTFFSAKVYIPDVDIDGDGYTDFRSTTRTIDLRLDSGSIEVIRLSAESTASLSILSSNNKYFTTSYTVFPGTFLPGDSIYILFNQVPSEENLEVTLMKRDTSGSEPVITTWPLETTLNGDMLNFNLPDDVLPGELYYIHVYATTKDNGSVFERSSAVFITPDNDLDAVKLSPEDSMLPTGPAILEVNQYIGSGMQFSNTWSGSNGVVFYQMDFDSSGHFGDYSSENGYSSTQVVLTAIYENTSWIPAYYNPSTIGFTKKFRITNQSVNAIDPSIGTQAYFNFDMASSSSYRMKTPDGQLAPNISVTLSAN